MARTKEFDQTKALDKAMELFWQKGYEATSIQDLVEHLGIGRRSLYDTFKSKHDLFVATLDRYTELNDDPMPSPLEEVVTPKESIRQMFEQIIDDSIEDKTRSGCFLVNSAVELAGQDDAVTVRAREACQRFEYKFHKLLSQAQGIGELDMKHDLPALAQYLTNAIFGIRVMAKMNPDRKALNNVMNLTLSILD
ncbi:MAG: TetR/AcrR family transcriptional regulator [Chloroflexota bacterium]